MRVLLAGTGAHPIPPKGYGAVERILFEYAAALRRAGNSVDILDRVYEGGSLAEYRFALRLPALVRREEYDILHASTPVVANRLALAGLPFVYTSHSRHWFWRATWRHRWGAWLERRAVRRAAATVALTVEVEAAMRRTLPQGWPRPLRVIPFGVDTSEFAPAWDRRTGRKALGVGVVLPLKRWEVAAAALRGTGLKLQIAGPIPDPPYARRVQAAGDAVELLGEVDDVRLRKLYSEADLLVHPSVVEVLPRAVLEAMASGLPVVGSSMVGSLFPNGRGGLAAPPGTTAEQLTRFFHASVLRLAADERLRREMGEAGRRRVIEDFSWDRIASAHLELYSDSGLRAS
ncbi:MAG: glycosyltransferase family 4 protein [Thermoplasmata archaeon]|nr:glycosyltransferase family 4 protein [Thermoplasmata archaeon]